MDAIHKFEQNLTTLETGFNVAGSIPVVSVVSGAVRAALGKIQLIAGAIFAAVGAIGTLLSRDPVIRARFEKMMDKGVEHILHGAANIGRGLTEFALGTTGYGSLVLLAIQLFSDKGFKPHFEYAGVRDRGFVAV